MISDKDTAKKTAKLLLEINAIKLQARSPFTWASGWKSPIYCDNRITLSYPEVRSFLKEMFVKDIQKKYPQVEVIAGVATGAIALGVLIAESLQLPYVYVRPQAKSHGRKNQIEGYLKPRQKVLVIEDLISTGMSSMNAVQALREAMAEVLGMYAIFTYNFSKSAQLFQDARLQVRTLSDYDTLLLQAQNTDFISEEDLVLLQAWKENPEVWNPNTKK